MKGVVYVSDLGRMDLKKKGVLSPTHRSRSAHPHVFRHLRDLVRRSVRDVRPGGGP